MSTSSRYDRILAEAKEKAKQIVEKENPKMEIKKSGKSACKYCGKEISLKGLYQHEKYCPENPINIAKREMDAKKELKQRLKREQVIKEQRQSSLKDIEEMENKIDEEDNKEDLISMSEKEDTRPVIPLSLCARDISYVKENKPFYMKVMGRKVGGKVYVEEVELMRL